MTDTQTTTTRTQSAVPVYPLVLSFNEPGKSGHWRLLFRSYPTPAVIFEGDTPPDPLSMLAVCANGGLAANMVEPLLVVAHTAYLNRPEATQPDSPSTEVSTEETAQ